MIEHYEGLLLHLTASSNDRQRAPYAPARRSGGPVENGNSRH